MNQFNDNLCEYPGGDLVAQGLADLKRNVCSVEALLVMVATTRLRDLGFEVLAIEGVSRPYEHALYEALESNMPLGAHAAYNALIQRLVSFVNTYSQTNRSDSP